MELTQMPNRLFVKKLLGIADQLDEREFRQAIESDPRKLAEYQLMKRIWDEAEHVNVFEQVDTSSDWKLVDARINRYSLNHKKIPLSKYILRIAALVILSGGLSIGFYKLLVKTGDTTADTGFISYDASNQKKDIILPDGSSVTLNTGAKLTFRSGFGTENREVILEGEAFFNVVHDPELPFKVFSGESVIEVVGTSFAVSRSDGEVRVSVMTGKVVLFSSANQQEKISIQANQSALISEKKEIIIEERIPVNELSWKTGHLIFDQTPIDSALRDIARHFKRNLFLETAPHEKITAEFQDQPLHEILGEITLVAGLQFDTTGAALIVKK